MVCAKDVSEKVKTNTQGDKMIILLLACLTEPTEEQIELRRKQSKCISRSSGSKPECWDEKDWEAFCERVACKNQ